MRTRVLSVVALVLLLCAGASSLATGATRATISAHLSKTSFTASQAASVRLTYRFSKTSRHFGYLITIRTGSRWQTVKRVTKHGSFKGSHTITVTRLFAGKTVKVGTYRLKLSADGNSKLIGFTVRRRTTPPPAAVRAQAGSWVTTTLSDAANGGSLTVTSMGFTVGSDRASVSAFGFGFDYSGTPAPPTYHCSGSGFSGMTSGASSPITNGHFSSPSPTGAWSGFVSGSAEGTFDSATSAHGTAQASGMINGPGCWGTSASTGTFSWTATWQSAG